MQTHGSFQAGVLSQAVNENGTVHPKLPVSLKFVGPNRRDAQYFDDTRTGGSDWGVEHRRRSDIQLKSMGSILDHRSTNHGTSQSALVSFVDELPYESRGNRYPPNHDPKANDVGKGNGILMNSKYQEYSAPHDDLESAVSHKRAKSGIGSEEDGTAESEGRTVVAIREEYHMQGRASPLDQIRSAWRRDRGGRGGKSRRLSASITGQIRLEDGTVFDRIEPTSPSQSRSYSPVSSPQFFRPTRDSNEREKRKESPLPGIFVTTTTTTTTT
ncbi:hypothetical protein FRC15_003505 [Serendipita sp. 397]|nr:hypothetical protein FRC15_003505 [Serendipita sp. 397]